METTIIKWSEELIVTKQFKNLNELIQSGLVEKHASNFGYEHLVNKTIERWSKVEINNIFIVDENPDENYGLDYTIWMHYKADGINFISQLTIGGASLTSAPLKRVLLNTKEYTSFQFSTNIFHKKDPEYRNELRDLSKNNSVIFSF